VAPAKMPGELVQRRVAAFGQRVQFTLQHFVFCRELLDVGTQKLDEHYYTHKAPELFAVAGSGDKTSLRESKNW
jgi:hypothetical protein